jgi:hypothetical protein
VTSRWHIAGDISEILAVAIVLGVPTRDPGGPAGLPSVGGGFVGRERELDRIGALLMGSARLVTLIGSGGIGKTRLAEEAARRLHRARHTPVFAVRLARLPKGADAAAVRDAVTAAVLVGGFVGTSAWDGAVQTLSILDAVDRVVSTMLIVDNCEHVLAGAAAVIADLLDAVPGLTVLATSREPLGWIDEQLEVVPPLSAKQSLELFRQRAELAGHPVTGSSQVALAEQVCGHMHGHPLCIRLAAARMFYEPLSMILEQLSGESDDMRMRWRHGPRVGSEGRHRTIGDVIACRMNCAPTSSGCCLIGCRCSPRVMTSTRKTLARVLPMWAQSWRPSRWCAPTTCRSGRATLSRALQIMPVFVWPAPRFVSCWIGWWSNRWCRSRASRMVWTGRTGAAELGSWGVVEHQARHRYQHRGGQASRGPAICVGVLSLRALYLIGSLPEIQARVEQTLAATDA